MEFSIGERITLLSVLPPEGDLLTMRVVRDARNALGFTEEEHKLYQFKQSGNSITWSHGEEKKDIPFGDKAKGIVKDALDKLSKDGKLRMEHLDLYDKFSQ
jgi:hypothetical protein